MLGWIEGKVQIIFIIQERDVILPLKKVAYEILPGRTIEEDHILNLDLGPSWIDPIVDYLEIRMLCKDKQEARIIAYRPDRYTS